MCIEREKATFKSREVNVLKECALALNRIYLTIWTINLLVFARQLVRVDHCYVEVTYWQAHNYRQKFEVFSINFQNQRIDHKISHEKS